MKHGIFLVFLTLFTTSGFAKKVSYKSDSDALDSIRKVCIKYWDKPVMAEMLDMKVDVMLEGKVLVFKEVSTYRRPAEKTNEVKTNITKVDISRVNLSRTFTNVMFVEDLPKAIRHTIAWGVKSADNKDENIKVYTIPLEYDNRSIVAELPTLKNAINYLSAKYKPKSKSGKWKEKVMAK